MPIDVNKVLGQELEPSTYEWTEKDLILYALGLGVGVGASPVDANVLKYTYENALEALPTFGVIPTFSCLMGLISMDGVDINPMMILHGEQNLEVLCERIPTKCKATNTARVTQVYDKGKGALIIVETETRDEKGKPIFRNEYSTFVRGEGGFGGEPGPAPGNEAPDRAPDVSVECPTLEHQAIIYRLSGDYNPLHIDPQMAAAVGFERPILHGLCTYGNIGRAVIEACCDDEPSRLRGLKARFAAPVIPGETIVTDIWKDSATELVVKARVKERGIDVVKNARATISG